MTLPTFEERESRRVDIVSGEMMQQHETRRMMMNLRKTKWSQHKGPKKETREGKYMT